MILNEAIKEIVDNVMKVSDDTNEESIMEMMEILTSSKNVFLLGQGRFWSCCKSFRNASHASGYWCVRSWRDHYSSN